MKKVLQEYKPEICEFFCDKHPNVRCFSKLKTTSWYGSDFDMMGVEIHLCDECIKEIYDYLDKTYNIVPTELSI